MFCQIVKDIFFGMYRILVIVYVSHEMKKVENSCLNKRESHRIYVD